tara:strand:+ start:2151 stop:2651 length:501 start_codon:yes stop_codon:yes gene_type:complete
MKKRYKFLKKHTDEFSNTLASLQGGEWSLSFPVFLFDRDWFRLKKITLYELSKELKPDNSQEAPEIIQYHQLLKEGHDQILAIQECWKEFGIEDFHRSLRNSSEWNSKGNNGWTFKKYAELLVRYRKIIENDEISIPIIILGRNPKEDHQLEWISKKFITELKIAS